MKIHSLGLDEKISWKPHIKYIQIKLSRSISVLNKAKQVLDHKSLRILYCSIVLPYFTYCVEIWGNNYISSINSLTILQKRTIRVINNVGYLDHTHSPFLQSKLVKLTDIVKFQTILIMYKAKNNLLPQNIQKLFRSRDGVYQLIGKHHFKINKIRTNRKRFCISFCGVRLWNSMGEELKQCPNITQFKTKYKECVHGIQG